MTPEKYEHERCEDLIEQLQERIAELEKALTNLVADIQDGGFSTIAGDAYRLAKAALKKPVESV